VKLEETIGELEAFSYSVSHDMRAPLRAMAGYAKALLADYHDRLGGEALHWLDRILRSAQRLDSLIKDVLAYSRVAKEQIALGPVDVERLIEDITSTHPEFQAPHARIVVEKPLQRVFGHEAYLTQCVSNLLSNAVKFVRPEAVPTVRIWSERLNGRVRVWFEDNGIGIAPAHHERIFQIFGRVFPDEKYSGTGIGLAIVRKAIQRMRGEVGVESQLDKGSRFWLILDAADDDG
jgi:signal transduction histidine kinase